MPESRRDEAERLEALAKALRHLDMMEGTDLCVGHLNDVDISFLSVGYVYNGEKVAKAVGEVVRARWPELLEEARQRARDRVEELRLPKEG